MTNPVQPEQPFQQFQPEQAFQPAPPVQEITPLQPFVPPAPQYPVEQVRPPEPQYQQYQQFQPAPQFMVQPMAVAVGPRNSGLAVAGMVVGIIALLGFWVPFGDVFLGLLAIALSWPGIVQAGKPGFAGRGMGIAGLVCGIVSLIPAILFMTLVFGLFTAAATTVVP